MIPRVVPVRAMLAHSHPHPYLIRLYVVFVYLLVAFCGIGLVWFLWNRLRNPFWSIQPVFHYWWLPYWCYDKGIIRADLPRPTRFTNTHAVRTWATGDLTSGQWKEWSQLVQAHYHQDAASRYAPALANIQPYFVGHEAPCFCSMYIQQESVLDTGAAGEVRQLPRVLGTITSRPLYVTFCEKGKNNPTIPVYYVDYLCVDTKHRKKGIAPQLIQTHEYNQSHRNRAICVSLFKREEELTGIVPLTCFTTYCFVMPRFVPVEVPGYDVVPVSQACAATYWDAMSRFRDAPDAQHQIWIAPCHGNQMELVKSGNWRVYMLLHDHQVQAIYFFRDTCIHIGDGGGGGGKVLSCFAAVRDCGGTDDDLFLFGFQRAVVAISDVRQEKKSAETNAGFGHLAVEGIGDTAALISHLRGTLRPVVMSPTAYYLFNFARRPVAPERCVVLS